MVSRSGSQEHRKSSSSIAADGPRPIRFHADDAIQPDPRANEDFGVVLGPGKGSTFVRQVEHNKFVTNYEEQRIPGDEIVKTVITSLLSAWKTITLELKKLDDQIKEVVRDSPVHTNLMTIPGIGVITAICTHESLTAASRQQEGGAGVGPAAARFFDSEWGGGKH
jgi:hypothetical protein